MTENDRLRAAGWRFSRGTNPPASHEWTIDGIDWYTEDEALVVVLKAEIERLTKERDAVDALRADAEARAERVTSACETQLARLREENGALTGTHRTMVARVEEATRDLATMTTLYERACTERDARPAITAEDAAHFTEWRGGTGAMSKGSVRGYNRVTDALAEHARKVKP